MSPEVGYLLITVFVYELTFYRSIMKHILFFLIYLFIYLLLKVVYFCHLPWRVTFTA